MKFEFKKSFFLVLLFLLDMSRLKKFIIIFICLLIHEIAHILMGKLFGLRTKKIICGLFGFRAKILDFNLLSSRKKFWILIAGPSINFGLWLLCNNLTLKEINLFIGSINLLPIYPLDGGRIFILILKKFFFNRANKLFMRLNKIMVFLICILGTIFQNLYLLSLGFYLFLINKILLDELIFELYFN